MSCTNCGGRTRVEDGQVRCLECGYIERHTISMLLAEKEEAMKSPKKGEGVPYALPLPPPQGDVPEEEDHSGTEEALIPEYYDEE